MASPAWRSGASRSVSGGTLLKSGVGVPASEMAVVSYVPKYASPGLARCVWSGQLMNSLRSDVHVGVRVSLQADCAVVEHCAAGQEWVSSAPVSLANCMVLLQTTESALLVSLMMTASQEKLMAASQGRWMTASQGRLMTVPCLRWGRTETPALGDENGGDGGNGRFPGTEMNCGDADDAVLC